MAVVRTFHPDGATTAVVTSSRNRIGCAINPVCIEESRSITTCQPVAMYKLIIDAYPLLVGTLLPSRILGPVFNL